MTGATKGIGREQKQNSYSKSGSQRVDEPESEQHAEDKQTGVSAATAENEGEEPYGDGEVFDDEDKAEGNGGRERRKIEIKFIQNKARRHITFSKRKHGIMKKAWELSVLTGTQVLLLVVSETGLVYTFTTPKLQPLVTQNEGKNLIQACLNAPDTSTDGNEDSADPDQDDSDGEMSPPPSSAPSAAGPEPVRPEGSQRSTQGAPSISQEAPNHLVAHSGQAPNGNSSTVGGSQEALSPQPAGHAAAVRAAAMQAQAQAIAVSNYPPQLQQYAAQGYKAAPANAQFAFQGYPYSAAPVGGQFGSQMPNVGQISGQFHSGAPIDSAQLMAMQQQDGLPPHNGGEYPPPMYPTQQMPPTHPHGKS